MNNADIEAARRLIAQFEGTALGRHNSSTWRENPVAPEESPYPTQARGRWIPEQRWHVTPKNKPEECDVGEYCWPQRWADRYSHQPLIRVIKQIGWMERIEMEFERVMVWMLDGQEREAWHRIA